MANLILLVDDDPVHGEARGAILARTGARVLRAGTGEGALELLADPGVRAELGLLVTDHIMPGIEGSTLVRRVRETLPDLPVLVLSGLPGAEAEYAGLEVAFRPKPFPPGELIRLATHMLGNQSLRSA